MRNAQQQKTGGRAGLNTAPKKGSKDCSQKQSVKAQGTKRQKYGKSDTTGAQTIDGANRAGGGGGGQKQKRNQNSLP